MLLLVGQGNPGGKYARNRHNVGFMLLDEIARKGDFAPWKSKFQAEVCEGRIGIARDSVKALLIKPQTFYNETGRSVAAAAKFYKTAPENIIVFHDEIDLAPGRLRMKKGGGHSGNNGMRSIMSHIGANVRRVRIGVGHPGDKSQVTNHVLSDFAKSEEPWVEALFDAVIRALPMLADGNDERFQTEVMRLAPAPKADPNKA